MTYAVTLLASVVAVILVFVPHEFAHAYIAYKNGDPTAKLNGRLTLNPVRHIDPAGIILCIFAGFGWARPVPVNTSNFRKYRKGLFTTAIAGVIANYIVAFLCYPICILILNFVYADNLAYLYAHPLLEYSAVFLYNIFGLAYIYSLSVFVFNLLPLYPLDGFRVLESFTREINPVTRFLKNNGQYILIVLIVESFVCKMIADHTSLPYVQYFNILGYLQKFAGNILGYPISAFWNWIIDPWVLYVF